MARTPSELLKRTDMPQGTKVTLTILYGEADEQEVQNWETGRRRLVPFEWQLVTREAIMAATGRSRGSVGRDLKRLRDLGLIRLATREGRRGWELFGTRAGQLDGDQAASSSGESRARPARPRCTKSQVTAAPSQTSGRSAPTSAASSDHLGGSPVIRNRLNALPRQDHQCAPPASALSLVVKQDSRTARQGEAGQGTSSPFPPETPWRNSRLLINAIREIDGYYTPCTDTGVVLESRRILPTKENTERLAVLLEPLEPLAEADQLAWTEHRLAVVHGYLRDYAEICAENYKGQRQWWGPDALESNRRGGKRSAWGTLLRIVDEWRALRSTRQIAAEKAKHRDDRAQERREASLRDEILAAVERPPQPSQFDRMCWRHLSNWRVVLMFRPKEGQQVAREAIAKAQARGAQVTCRELTAALSMVQVDPDTE